MPRARRGAARRQSKVRVFQKVKGNRGARRTQWRRVQEAVVRAGVNQYTHRRTLKREYRQLWITRINAAARLHGLRYAQFIDGLKRSNVDLNRKMLSEMAIHDEAGFAAVAELAKQGLATKPAPAATA